MKYPHASSFVLACAQCAATATIDTLATQWHERLSEFATDHAGHLQSVVPVREPHDAAS